MTFPVRWSATRTCARPISARKCTSSRGWRKTTGFPDGHFDLVYAYILFHEVPASVTRAIVKEVHRITRPGGVFQSGDFPAEQRPPTPYRSFRRWWDHRWNNEVWRYEFQDMHFPNEIAKAGFTVRKSERGLGFLGSLHATRNA